MKYATCFMICLCLGPSLLCYSQEPRSDNPQPASQPSLIENIIDRLNVLRQFGKALGEIGDGLKKLTDGVKYAVQTATGGLDELAARDTRAKLIELVRQATVIPSSQTRVIQDIDEYVENPTPEGWIQVKQKLSNIFDQVNGLHEIITKHKSQLVLSPVYAQLNQVMNQRLRLLEKLRDLTPPTNEDELAEVRKISKQYKLLLEEMKRARNELTEYVKQQEARRTSGAQ